MCGISGVFSRSIPETERKAIVASMNDDLIHRGPDSSGVYSDSSITLGHRRLSIIDLSAGNQPMSYESYHVVFNGEIYNYRKVREELKSLGHQFVTNSDTEVIVHAFAQWGPESVKRLTGMFAFALWDSKKECLYLFRDRIGIKPLYYCHFNKGLVFSSEISPLFRVKEVSRGANKEALVNFFMFGYSIGPGTAFKDIYELPPAHWAEFDGKSIPVIRPYWTLSDVSSFKGSFEDACISLDNLLNNVVEEHLISDVPVSTFLSGGIDSSSITALSKKKYSGNLEAFTVSFPDLAYDESHWAKIVADHIKVKHTVINMNQMPLCIGDIENVVKHVGQPFADSSCLPTYFVCKAASEKYKVVLSGDGADELFFGYNTFDWYSKIIFLRNMPLFIRKLCATLLELIPDSKFTDERLRQAEKALRYSYLREDEAIIYLNAILDPSQLEEIFTGKFSELKSKEFSYLVAGNGNSNPLRTMIKFLLGQSLPQDMLKKVDRMSMRTSLEVRVPFLDHRVVEFAYSLPEEFLIRNGVRKYILRSVMSKYLPEEVFTHKKQGFAIPLHYYYDKEFLDSCEDLLLPSNSIIRQIMPDKTIKSVLEANRNLKTTSKRKLSIYTWTHLFWMMLQFEIWVKKYNVSF